MDRIIIDVGRPWLIWRIPVSVGQWNLNSALLEVALCVMAYVTLFVPEALRSRKHRNPRHGLAETRRDGVSFRFGDALYSFRRKDFLYNGKFPIPA